MPKDKSRIDQTKSTNARTWCEHCRTFVYNNAISRANHEASPKHKERLQQTVERIRSRAEQEERILAGMERRSGVRIGGAGGGGASMTPKKGSFYEERGGASKEPLLGAPRKSTAASLGGIPQIQPGGTTTPYDHSDNTNNSRYLAEHAIPGPWQPVKETLSVEPTIRNNNNNKESTGKGKSKISFSLRMTENK